MSQAYFQVYIRVNITIQAYRVVAHIGILGLVR
jgi:hypothetical protein